MFSFFSKLTIFKGATKNAGYQHLGVTQNKHTVDQRNARS